MTAGWEQLAQACLTKRIHYLGFGLTETHVADLDKYLIVWVKDEMGTDGRPICNKLVAAAKANAAAEADKPKDMTPKDRENKTKQPQRNHRRTASMTITSTAIHPKQKRRQSNTKKRSSGESGSEIF